MSTTQQRYMRRGVSKFFFLKAIAAASNIPARTELAPTNATDLSPAISDIEGWALENAPIDTPDMASAFTSTAASPSMRTASTTRWRPSCPRASRGSW
ncbi:hypothetical protein [Streptomyces sp. NPDC056632]|uniref:phage tail tube protein n=1 Tax=Streptomyces sp. NPDC056632 TaxID=3345884 RepID=UPI0036A43EFC